MRKYFLHFVVVVIAIFIFAEDSFARPRYGRRKLTIKSESKELLKCDGWAQDCYSSFDIDTGVFSSKSCTDRMKKCGNEYAPTVNDCEVVLNNCYAENCAPGTCSNISANMELGKACLFKQNYYFIYNCGLILKGQAGLVAQQSVAMAQAQQMQIEQSRADAEKAKAQAEKYEADKRFEMERQLEQQRIQAQAQQAQIQAEAQLQAERERIASEERQQQAELELKKLEITKSAERSASSSSSRSSSYSNNYEAKMQSNNELAGDFLEVAMGVKKSLAGLKSLLGDVQEIVGYEYSNKDSLMWIKTKEFTKKGSEDTFVSCSKNVAGNLVYLKLKTFVDGFLDATDEVESIEGAFASSSGSANIDMLLAMFDSNEECLSGSYLKKIKSVRAILSDINSKKKLLCKKDGMGDMLSAGMGFGLPESLSSDDFDSKSKSSSGKWYDEEDNFGDLDELGGGDDFLNSIMSSNSGDLEGITYNEKLGGGMFGGGDKVLAVKTLKALSDAQYAYDALDTCFKNVSIKSIQSLQKAQEKLETKSEKSYDRQSRAGTVDNKSLRAGDTKEINGVIYVYTGEKLVKAE